MAVLAYFNIEIKLQSIYLKHLQKLIDNGITAKWKFFATYWMGFSLRKYNSNLASNSIPHTFDIPLFYQKCFSALRQFEKSHPSIDFTTISINCLYLILLKPVLKRPRVISHYPLLDFRQIWTNTHNSFVDPFSRDLTWKIIHGCLPVNFLLNKFRISPTARCPFCTDIETIEHLFVFCPLTRHFYKYISSWLREIVPNLNFSTALLCFNILPTTITPIQSSTLLYLLCEIRQIIWLSRNMSKYENANIGRNYLILAFLRRIKFRLYVDYHRLPTNTFLSFWDYPRFCRIIDGNLEIAFSV